MTKDEKLTQRTIRIIEKHGRILLKADDGWYLGQWTNIAGGPDKAEWSRKAGALEMFNLQWAFTIAPLYDCKVVVVYPKG
jgi:hypothetical protein